LYSQSSNRACDRNFDVSNKAIPMNRCDEEPTEKPEHGVTLSALKIGLRGG